MINIKPIASIAILLFTGTINSEESKEGSSDKPTEQAVTIEFNVSNLELQKIFDTDQILEIDVANNKHLVIKHISTGRKERGNVLLLHTNGESPANNRLIQPLAKQLTRLGWNLFIPNIAKEDFKKKPTYDQKIEVSNTNNDDVKSEDKTKKETESNINDDNAKYYFSDEQKYQTYFTQLCQQILKTSDIAEKPMIIITNQNTSYWGLDCLQHTTEVTPIILLAPELPRIHKNELESKFSQQTSPLFSFRVNKLESDPFGKAFMKRIWKSKIQRVNIGMLSYPGIELEDNSVAKAITGWVEKLRKTN